MRHFRRLSTLLFVGLLVLAAGLFRPNLTEAHTVVQEGPYAFIAGWELEPAIVGERNTFYIDIMRNNEPIAAAEARLSLTLQSADGESRPVAASPLPTEDTLRYNITFIPTAAGEMSVTLSGLLGEDQIDVTVTPELVNEADVIQFPNVALSNVDLQDAMINIETRVATAQQRATIGIGVGVAGVLFGLAGIVIGRKKT